MLKESKKGFTLLEIMIIAVIICLLASMATPAIQKMRELSENKRAVYNSRKLADTPDQLFLDESRSTTAVDTNANSSNADVQVSR